MAVTNLKLSNLKTGAKSELPVQGVFMAIGHEPNTRVFRDQLKCDETGYLNWWLSHVPRNNGRTDGIDNDWWHYILIDARVTRAAWNRSLA